MKYKFLFAVLFVAVSIFASNYAFRIKQNIEVAHATGGDPVLGWLWMDNVGWISLSSNNDSDPNTPGVQTSTPAYGVYQDASTYEWTGDAWSPVLGWLHFSPSSCPSGTTTDIDHPCGVRLINGQLVGFAEFLTTQPWWDPYVSFSSENDHDPATSGIQASSVTYGTTVNSISGIVSGNAWHSNGGWMSFFQAYIQPNTMSGPITLKAGDVTITLDAITIGLTPDPFITPASTTDVRLTWMKDPTATNYTTCSITSNVTNITTPVNCPTAVNPLEYTIVPFASPLEVFTLSASDGNVTDTATATVTSNSTCSVNATWQVAPSCPPGSLNYVAPKMKWWTNSATTSCTAISPNTTWMTVSPTAGSNVVQSFSTPPADGSVYQVQCTDTLSNTCLSPSLQVNYLPLAGFCTDGPPPNTPQCSDGIDNDGDGLVDFVDNDGDTVLDPQVDVDPPIGVNDFQTDNIANNIGPGPWALDSYADTGCTSPTDNSESRNNVIIKEK